MFVTSKNPKYLNLGRDIENATLRMAHMRRLIDMMQGCLGSGVTVLESFKDHKRPLPYGPCAAGQESADGPHQ